MQHPFLTHSPDESCACWCWNSWQYYTPRILHHETREGVCGRLSPRKAYYYCYKTKRVWELTVPQLTVPHLPRKLDLFIRSATDLRVFCKKANKRKLLSAWRAAQSKNVKNWHPFILCCCSPIVDKHYILYLKASNIHKCIYENYLFIFYTYIDIFGNFFIYV